MIERKTTTQIYNMCIDNLCASVISEDIEKVWLSEESVKEALAEIEHYIVGVQMSQEEWVEWKKTRLGLQEK